MKIGTVVRVGGGGGMRVRVRVRVKKEIWLGFGVESRGMKVRCDWIRVFS